MRSDSEPCRRAVEYWKSLEQRQHGLRIEVLDVDADKRALAQFWHLVRHFEVAVTLSHRRVQEQQGCWLKLLSGAVMGLGLMILRPWLG